MKPEDVIKKTTAYLNNLEKSKRLKVKVGLPQETASGKAYGDGISVLQVGIWHEYGTKDIPMRSFIRAPFVEKREDVNKYISSQFNNVFEDGTDAEIALGRIGVKGTNICKEAFKTKGFGKWSALKPATIKDKGSSGILIDTGLLRNSITWVLEG